MNKALHHIYKQKILLDYDDEHTALLMQQRWSDICNNHLPPVLNVLLDRYFPQNETIVIKSIEIDIGVLTAQQSNQEWVEIIVTKIEQQLQAVTQQIENVNLTDDAEQDELQLLLHFLQFGSLPFWVNTNNDKNYVEKLLDKTLQYNTGVFLAGLKKINDNLNVIKRLAWNFKAQHINQIVIFLAPKHGARVQAAIKELPSPKQSDTMIPVLHYLINGSSTDANILSLLRVLRLDLTSAKIPALQPISVTKFEPTLNTIEVENKGAFSTTIPSLIYQTNDTLTYQDNGTNEAINYVASISALKSILFFIQTGRWRPQDRKLTIAQAAEVLEKQLLLQSDLLPQMFAQVKYEALQQQRLNELLLAVTQIPDSAAKELILFHLGIITFIEPSDTLKYKLTQDLGVQQWLDEKQHIKEQDKKAYEKAIKKVARIFSRTDKKPLLFNDIAKAEKLFTLSNKAHIPYIVVSLFKQLSSQAQAKLNLHQYLQDTEYNAISTKETQWKQQTIYTETSVTPNDVYNENNAIASPADLIEAIRFYIKTGRWRTGDKRLAITQAAEILEKQLIIQNDLLPGMLAQSKHNGAQQERLNALLLAVIQIPGSVARDLILTHLSIIALTEKPAPQTPLYMVLRELSVYEWISNQQLLLSAEGAIYRNLIKKIAPFFNGMHKSPPSSIEISEIGKLLVEPNRNNTQYRVVLWLLKQLEKNKQGQANLLQYLKDTAYQAVQTNNIQLDQEQSTQLQKTAKQEESIAFDDDLPALTNNFRATRLYIQTGRWPHYHQKITFDKAARVLEKQLLLQSDLLPELLAQTKHDTDQQQRVNELLLAVAQIPGTAAKELILLHLAIVILTDKPLPQTPLHTLLQDIDVQQWLNEKQLILPEGKKGYGKSIKKITSFFSSLHKSPPSFVEIVEMKKLVAETAKDANRHIILFLFKHFEKNKQAQLNLNQYLQDTAYKVVGTKEIQWEEKHIKYEQEAIRQDETKSLLNNKFSNEGLESVRFFIQTGRCRAGYQKLTIQQAAEVLEKQLLLISDLLPQLFSQTKYDTVQQTRLNDVLMAVTRIPKSAATELILFHLSILILTEKPAATTQLYKLLQALRVPAWLKEKQRIKPFAKKVHEENIKRLTDFFSTMHTSVPTLAAITEIEYLLGRDEKQANQYIILSLFKKLVKDTQSRINLHQFLQDTAYKSIRIKDIRWTDEKIKQNDNGVSQNWQAIHSHLVNNVNSLHYVDVKVSVAFNKMFENQFAYLLTQIKELTPYINIVEKFSALVNDHSYKKILAALIPAQFATIIETKTLIEHNIKDNELAVDFNSIMLTFFLQLQVAPLTHPVGLIKNLISYKSPGKKRFNHILSLLDELVHKEQGKRNNLFYDAIAVLKTDDYVSAKHKKTAGKKQDHTEALVFLLKTFQWPVTASIQQHKKYLQGLQKNNFIGTRAKIINYLKNSLIREWLALNLDEVILLEIAPFYLLGDSTKLKNYIAQFKMALQTTLAEYDKLTLKHFFWKATFAYLTTTPKFEIFDYTQTLITAIITVFTVTERGLTTKLLAFYKSSVDVDTTTSHSVLQLIKINIKGRQIEAVGSRFKNMAVIEQLKLIEDKYESPDELFISNAGIVILYPYISLYLERLGLLEGVKLKDKETQLKAINTLQFLVTGEDNHNEFELMFIKIICGMPATEVYKQQQPLSDEDKVLANSLLLNVISQWSTIGDTSIEGLRVSFLQRNGKLNFTDEAIYLNVEPAPFDMLIDYLPWSISLINFSWLEKIIHVSWRKTAEF